MELKDLPIRTAKRKATELYDASQSDLSVGSVLDAACPSLEHGVQDTIALTKQQTSPFSLGVRVSRPRASVKRNCTKQNGYLTGHLGTPSIPNPFAAPLAIARPPSVPLCSRSSPLAPRTLCTTAGLQHKPHHHLLTCGHFIVTYDQYSCAANCEPQIGHKKHTANFMYRCRHNVCYKIEQDRQAHFGVNTTIKEYDQPYCMSFVIGVSPILDDLHNLIKDKQANLQRGAILRAPAPSSFESVERFMTSVPLMNGQRHYFAHATKVHMEGSPYQTKEWESAYKPSQFKPVGRAAARPGVIDFSYDVPDIHCCCHQPRDASMRSCVGCMKLYHPICVGHSLGAASTYPVTSPDIAALTRQVRTLNLGRMTRPSCAPFLCFMCRIANATPERPHDLGDKGYVAALNFDIENCWRAPYNKLLLQHPNRSWILAQKAANDALKQDQQADAGADELHSRSTKRRLLKWSY